MKEKIKIKNKKRPNQTVNAENAPAAIFSVQMLKEKDSFYRICIGTFPVTSSLGIFAWKYHIPNWLNESITNKV
jgi:hypothetical protein